MRQQCVKSLVVCALVGAFAFVMTLPVATAQSVASPWVATNIGGPSPDGTASDQGGQFTLSAGGLDIGGRRDQFLFVNQQLSGDVDIVARVDSLSAADPWTKVGVMIRADLSARAANAMTALSGANGIVFQARAQRGAQSQSVPGPVVGAPQWVRLKRTGTIFTGYSSADGGTWQQTGSITIGMGQSVYAGLAIASHNPGVAATAVLSQVAVNGRTTGQPPPTVSLTAPSPGAQFTAPATIVVSASASDPANLLAHVDFYANSTKIGTVTAAPFTITWQSVPSGTYSLTAVAASADGLSATSGPVTITVAPQTTTPPRYAVFQASPDHATLVTSYRFDVFANGADPATATPVASTNLGKPTPDASGTITVDLLAFFTALAPATYEATVSAIGAGGESRSSTATFTR